MTTLKELLTPKEIDIIENINKAHLTEINYSIDVDLLTWKELELIGMCFFYVQGSNNLAIKAIHVLTSRAIEQNKPIFI